MLPNKIYKIPAAGELKEDCDRRRRPMHQKWIWLIKSAARCQKGQRSRRRLPMPQGGRPRGIFSILQLLVRGTQPLIYWAFTTCWHLGRFSTCIQDDWSEVGNQNSVWQTGGGCRKIGKSFLRIRIYATE